jgi:hypothetical protein
MLWAAMTANKQEARHYSAKPAATGTRAHAVYRTFERLAVEVPLREDVIVDHGVDRRQAQPGLDLESLRARDVQLPCGNCPGCW